MRSTRTGGRAAGAAISKRSEAGWFARRELFLSACLALGFSLFLSLFGYFGSLGGGAAYLILGLCLIFIAVTAFLLRKTSYTLLAIGLVVACALLDQHLAYFPSLKLQAGMLFLALYFIGDEIPQIIGRNIGSPRKIAIGVLHAAGIYMATVALLVTLVLLANALFHYVPDNAGVLERVSGFPLYITILAFTLAPLSEELLFRGFLARRFGVVLSSLVFAVVHAGYNSLYEIAAAFLIGAVLAVYFTRTKNIVPCIIAHAIFNFVSIAVMYIAGQYGISTQ